MLIIVYVCQVVYMYKRKYELRLFSIVFTIIYALIFQTISVHIISHVNQLLVYTHVHVYTCIHCAFYLFLSFSLFTALPLPFTLSTGVQWHQKWFISCVWYLSSLNIQTITPVNPLLQYHCMYMYMSGNQLIKPHNVHVHVVMYFIYDILATCTCINVCIYMQMFLRWLPQQPMSVVWVMSSVILPGRYTTVE